MWSWEGFGGMNKKTVIRNVSKGITVWTGVVVGVNIIYVPYLIFTTSGGEQRALNFIVWSMIWCVAGAVVIAGGCFLWTIVKGRRD